MKKAEKIRKIVKAGYGKIARESGSCCGGGKPCGGRSERVSRGIGYRRKDLKSAPEGSNLGLGCGNPTALASLSPGETVLDLGSGAGFDCFLSARRVGPKGKVIGIDMTPEMIARARRNAKKDGTANVEFRLGDIEKMPVDSGSVDVVISNCVINLVPDKRRAFKEAFRVLEPGGRMFVSDLVLRRPLPKKVLDASSALIGCIAGAWKLERYVGAIKAAGFRKVRILERKYYPLKFITEFVAENQVSKRELARLTKTVVSINVAGFKPAHGRTKTS